MIMMNFRMESTTIERKVEILFFKQMRVRTQNDCMRNWSYPSYE